VLLGPPPRAFFGWLVFAVSEFPTFFLFNCVLFFFLSFRLLPNGSWVPSRSLDPLFFSFLVWSPVGHLVLFPLFFWARRTLFFFFFHGALGGVLWRSCGFPTLLWSFGFFPPACWVLLFFPFFWIPPPPLLSPFVCMLCYFMVPFSPFAWVSGSCLPFVLTWPRAAVLEHLAIWPDVFILP